MILIISTCNEKFHELEFVKPIEDILSKNKIPFQVKNYKDITKKDLENSGRVIISGTSLKDNEFLNNLKYFKWIKNYEKPILGICSGSHIIGLTFGYELKKNTQIGLKKINIKDSFLGLKGEKQVYHLHNFKVLPDIWKSKTKDIYCVLFHPEVRNKELIVYFINKINSFNL